MKKGCFAVIFSNKIKDAQDPFYRQLSESLRALALSQEGYVGLESYRNPDGTGTTISYWDSKEAILNWKKQSEHLVAQQYGKEKAYEYYSVQVCQVERSYTHSSHF